MANKPVFTPDQVAIIHAEWERGTSVREIGEIIGKTKASVGAKIFRLPLTRRPSPIKRLDAAKQKPAQAYDSNRKPGRPQTAHNGLYAPEIVRKAYVGEKPLRGDECLWCEGQPGAWVVCRKKIATRFFCDEHAVLGLVKNTSILEKD